MFDRIMVLIFIIVPIGFAVAAFMSALFQNRFTVEHPERQWLALRNVLTSKISFIRQGTVYRPPWVVLDTEVDLNKEERDTGEGHIALTEQGAAVRVMLRYNELSGRPFNENNGQLEDADRISEKPVLWAITRTDFEDREAYVAGFISAVIDWVIGCYTTDQLLQPSEQEGGFKVPLVPSSNYPIQQRTVTSKPELLIALSEWIQRETNWRLRHVGFNVDELMLQDLRPVDASVQEALDRRQRYASARRASDELRGLDMSDREKFANPNQQGEVAKAQGMVAIAASISDFAKSLASSVEKAFSHEGDDNE